MNIVLHEPEIPLNTGNIGRTCVATGCTLHLIRPLGFYTDDKSLKRAGMDYWPELDVRYYNDFGDFLTQNHLDKPGARLFMATTKGLTVYTDVKYEPDDYLMFGKESAGIPEEILLQYPQAAIRIPMLGETRSLNLANSVAIVLYEALRQNDFSGLKLQGQLHRHTWSEATEGLR
jgi:tRNA (cytidine/uridine-2'-O-)-methyltransferase